MLSVVVTSNVALDPDKLRVGLEEAAALIESEAKSLCPVRTSNLKNSIFHDVTGSEAVIGATASYAADVEFGTRPHIISVVNASVLTDGESFFGKTVNHPGIVAQPYLYPAYYAHEKDVAEIIKSALER